QLHRWIAYGLGALVLLWIMTGVVMMFPPPPTTRQPAAGIVDPAAAARTPAEAFEVLALGEPAVRSVTLRQFAGRTIYDFTLPDGSHAFVDATTAQRVTFDDALARLLLGSVVMPGTTPRRMVRLAQHDRQYRFGALPAYRFELDDAQATLVHVAADGVVTSTSRRGRFRAVMAALHEFQVPGGLIPQQPRKLLLLGASALTIVLVVTGYVLVLPARWFARRSKAS
ncbi:MAG: PepSY domain-containing protein, partial [Gemmatimonadota bacterium]